MSISLTESARRRVLGYLELDPTALGLRFGVSRSGCSGWGYKVEVARNTVDGDAVFDDAGVRIYVDAASLAQVEGSRFDYLLQGLNALFVFEYPNVTGGCGCGSSFTTDADKLG